MKLFKYLLLVLLLCNIPSFVLVNFGSSAGSLISYLSFALMLLYYFVNKKHKLAWPFVVFTFTFFIISGLIYIPDEKYFFIDFIKYLILIVVSGELARRTSLKELYIILLIGVSSILVNAAVFGNDYGRYSGFYLDPNSAGFACLLGVALSFGIVNEKWKLLGLFFFTFCGVLTFSRTFFLLWIILIMISIFQNIKNIKISAIGIGALILLISVATIFQLNTKRFSIVDSFFNNGVISRSINENSRTETWAMFYDKIFESPFIGNGYLSFSGVDKVTSGVHNNYLRVIGEAGIFPFFIFVGIYLFILIKSLKTFKNKPYQFLLAISLITLHLTNHNFDTINHVTFISIWIYLILSENKDEKISIPLNNT